jgi:hypothetical protein
MSLVAEILDRLTGIAVVREKLSESGHKVDRLAEGLLDHEKRLIRLELTVLPPRAPARTGKTISKK